MAQMVRQQIDTNGMYRNQGVVLISGDTNRSLPFLPVKIYPWIVWRPLFALSLLRCAAVRSDQPLG